MAPKPCADRALPTDGQAPSEQGSPCEPTLNQRHQNLLWALINALLFKCLINVLFLAFSPQFLHVLNE